MANFSSSPSANIVSSSLLARIQNSLGQPLPYRCKDVEDMIASNSIKDLSHVLQGLLESIFGFGAEPGWGLDSITKTQQPVEFDSLVQLLAPEGQLLQLVYNLQIDPYITYDFPFGSLPAPTRSTIEEGSLPIFFVNKIQYQSYTKPTVVLIWMSLKVCRVVKGKGLKRGLLQIKLSSVDDAFELYIFYFSHALVSVQWQNKSNSWNNLTDIVYPHLLDNYLGFFLPLNKKGLPNFPQSPTTGVRTPMMQQTPVSIRHSPNSGTQTRSRTRLGLFKASLLSPQKQHSQSSPGTEKMEGDLWWSETFIQILAEFWLNQNSLDSDRGISPQSLESFLPSNNHVRLCRLLLKHVHFFVNSAEQEIITTAYQTADVSPLDEFKRSLIPSILQKKIYGFLKNSFEKWPLDSSFKWILETWLTYIQPWRYVECTKRAVLDKDSDNVSEIWFPFIRDNFLFYSVLFQEFLNRSKRMHLTSPYNAHIVFRVSKVFNLPTLPHLLHETEKMMYSSLFKQSEDLGGSYLAHEFSMVLRVQLSELERPDFTYVNLFGKETEKQVRELVSDLHSAKLRTESVHQLEKKSVKSGFSSMFDFSAMFETTSKGAGDLSTTETKALVSYLEKGLGNLCSLFALSVPVQSSPLPPSTPHRYSSGQFSYNQDQSSFLNQSMSSSVQSTPDCHYTSQGPQLTELGRYQLINGLRKFEIGYQGDPDLQLIRSFENATLVRLLHRFSSYINRQFKDEITSLYNRNDLLGKLSKVYFAPPLSPGKAPSSPVSQRSLQALQTPRFSLRFLANYQTMLYLGLVYLMLSFFLGFGPIGYVLFLMGLVLVYGLCRVVVMEEEITVR